MSRRIAGWQARKEMNEHFDVTNGNSIIITLLGRIRLKMTTK